MKHVLTILLSFFSLSLSAQIYQNRPEYGWNFNRIKVVNTLHLPTDTALNSNVLDPGALVYNTGDSALYAWNGAWWIKQGRSGSGASIAKAIDSSFRRNDSIVYRMNNGSFFGIKLNNIPISGVIGLQDSLSNKPTFAAADARYIISRISAIQNSPGFNISGKGIVGNTLTVATGLAGSNAPLEVGTLPSYGNLSAIFSGNAQGVTATAGNHFPILSQLYDSVRVRNVTTDTTTDIAAMCSYSGTASTINVKDRLRGGLFTYYPGGQIVDSGTVFPATGRGGGYWVRQYYPKNTLHVTWFGAKHDFDTATMSGTDDSYAIQKTINTVFSNKGGVIFFPQGIYLIANNPAQIINGVQHYAQLYLPQTSYSDSAYSNIEFRGESVSNYEMQAIVRTPLSWGGATLYSNWYESTNRGAALLGYEKGKTSPFGAISYTTLYCDKIQFITSQRQGAGYMSAVDMGGITQAYIGNLRATIDVPLFNSYQPRDSTFGLRMPIGNNHAWCNANDVYVSGYGIGAYFGEHTAAIKFVALGNYKGLQIDGGYGVSVQHGTFEDNVINVSQADVNVGAFLSMNIYEAENYDPSFAGNKWFNHQFDIQSNQLGRVNIMQSIIHAPGTGAIPIKLSQSNIKLKLWSSEPGSTYITADTLFMSGRTLLQGISDDGQSSLQALNAIKTAKGFMATGQLPSYIGGAATLEYNSSLGGILSAYDYSTTTWKNLILNSGGGRVGVKTTAPTSTLHVNGSIVPGGLKTITAARTLDETDYYINAANTANIIITLPTAVGITGRTYVVKKTGNNASTITFNTTASQTIDGAASGTLVLGAFNNGYTFYSDGANWFIKN